MSITYEVKVDWDATNWMATPDFSDGIDDISNYIKKLFVDRGKNVGLGNIPSGVVEITLDNQDRRFTPTYSSSPLYGKMRPWLPIRVRATVTGGSAITFYTGFISRISVNSHINVKEAYLYCTDGMDLLARNMVTTEKTTRGMVTDGAAVGHILDAAGWPSGKRSIDTDTNAAVNYPSVTEY